MMLTIPFPKDTAFFSTRVELDGSTYILSFSWNARADCWFCDMADVDGVALVNGLALVSNWPLLRQLHHLDGVPAGELMAIDPTDTIMQADYTQIADGSVTFTYFTAEEIAAYRATIAAGG